MRNLATEFINRLKENNNFLCRGWEFIRNDGLIARIVEHDENLIINNDEFVCAHSIGSKDIATSIGIAAESSGIDINIDNQIFKFEDIVLQRWNNAVAKCIIVDWQLPQHNVQIWSGMIKTIELKNQALNIELLGQEQNLNNSINQTYNKNCSANFCDPKCGLNINQNNRKISKQIGNIIGQNTIEINNFILNNQEAFSNGKVKFTSGILTGIEYEIANIYQNINLQIELKNNFKLLPQANDNIDILMGCDKSFKACKTIHNNKNNFRGFPHLISEIDILKAPKLNENGGSRY